jgi:RNA polymerase primary sigma factor
MRSCPEKVTSQDLTARLNRLRLSAEQKIQLRDILENPGHFLPIDSMGDAWMGSVDELAMYAVPISSIASGDTSVLFLHLNYTRYKICMLRRKLWGATRWHKSDITEILSWRRRNLELRNVIVTNNMWLVLAMAKRVHYTGIEYADLVSEGYIALMRSVEKYDYTLGFKFSTYACRAILSGFARAARKGYRYCKVFATQLDMEIVQDHNRLHPHEAVQEELLDEIRYVVRDNLADLSQIERLVVEMRFSFKNESSGQLTLKQVGEQIGLSRERIRQIQNKALAKLREAVKRRLAYA